MSTLFDETQLKAFLLKTFADYGIIVTDSHFVYASGKHGDTYVNKDAIYVHPQLINQVTTLMAFIVRDLGIPFTVIAGPALGGIPLAQLLAQKWLMLFGENKKIVVVEKGDGEQYVLKRGYDQIVANQKVLLVEDILTTGKSVGLCIEALRRYQAMVVQVINIWQRGEDIVTHGVPFKPLMKHIFPMYDAAECPLCREKIPINTVLGKGAQFLKGDNK